MARAKARAWIVPGKVIEVHDGDTFKAELDLGWRLAHRVTIRLARVNAPELPSEAGVAAQSFLRELLPAEAAVMVESQKLDKYGRTLAEIILSDGRNISDLALAAGQAVAVK